MNTPEQISYSDGRVIKSPVVQVWDDLHTERRGSWYRAFWTAGPDSDSGSPVIGYCSPGGSQRTIRACVAEVRRLYPDVKCFRNGKPVN